MRRLEHALKKVQNPHTQKAACGAPGGLPIYIRIGMPDGTIRFAGSDTPAF